MVPVEFIAQCLLVFGVLLSAAPMVLAQGADSEPNNTCTEAQDVGLVGLPFVIEGSLDTPPEVPDVDFFRLSGVPGNEITVDYEGAATGKGTLEDPYLGLYDSACNLVQINDDYGSSTNSRLRFVVPQDGVFILAASSCCDETHNGQGASDGTYQITIAPPSPSIGSIGGRVIDDLTGMPLSGQLPPFAYVELLKCTDEECAFEASQSARNDGRFLFVQNSAGDLLEVGAYQIRVLADDHESAQTDRFVVSENEAMDLGDIRLPPPMIQFSEVRHCNDLPSEGGLCRYSVRITNNQSKQLTGSAWSLVDGTDIGSPYGYTLFQAGERDVRIEPGESSVVNFEFDVPRTVATGAFICTQVFVGQSPQPRFNTIGWTFLFCLEKEQLGFAMPAGEQTQNTHRNLRKNLRALHKLKPSYPKANK